MEAKGPLAADKTAGNPEPGSSPGEPTAPAAVSERKRLLFPDHAQFWFETQRAFGAAGYGGSEFGEVLATAARITPGDFDSWYEAWNATALEELLRSTTGLLRGESGTRA